MKTDQFTEDERPTTPTKKEHEAARLVRLWSASSEKDREKMLRLAEKCALANQGAVEWS